MRATIGLVVPAIGCAPGVMPAAESDVHRWSFDEGKESLALDPTGDRTGTVHGAQWVAGRLAGGLRFDGADDYVALPRMAWRTSRLMRTLHQCWPHMEQ